MKPDKSKQPPRGGRNRYRGSHRARSDREANAAGQPDQPEAIPDHPLIPDNQPPVLTTDSQMADLVVELRAAGSFACDTEFISEMSYFPELCVVQVATTERVVLIDPLAGVDVSPLLELIADPSVETILHAGVQDLEPVYRHIGRPAENVFDTQIAGGFLDLPYPLSLGNAVHEFLGMRISKGQSFTDWSRRPLSEAQLRYAADDVRYLPAVREVIRQRLDAAGHAEWARAECASLSDASLYRFDPLARAMRFRGAQSFRPQRLALLAALVSLRDQVAREQDVPPRTALKDDVLLALARNPVKKLADLHDVRGLPRPVERAWGKGIVRTTVETLALPKSELPVTEHHRESSADRVRISSLWAMVQSYCLGQGIDPALVANRSEVVRLYHVGKKAGDLDGLRMMQGWRKELLGSLLQEFLRGGATVTLDWSEGKLRAETDQSPPAG